MSRPGLKEATLASIKSERGSISVLTMGLFSLLLITALILSNITTIYLAKRTLILASEAAVQRGGKNLDQAAYYAGEYNLTEFLQGILGNGGEDPGIPIDCRAGESDAREIFTTWLGKGERVSRKSIRDMQLTFFQCDGFQIYLESSAQVEVPFPLPFIGVKTVTVRSSAGGVSERSETNNYYGIDLG